jgi:hypothetical protein
VIGVILVVFIMIVLFLFLAFAFYKYMKITRKSQIKWVQEGINKSSRKLAVQYYIHFFGQRIIPGILITLSSSID